MDTPLKHVRYLPQGDDAGRAELLKTGYQFRGISKKGNQVFVLADQSVGSIEEEAVDAIETTFGLERDLQESLLANIAQLEKGLHVASKGKEHSVPSGRIDILASDAQGRNVVIELKAGTADRDAVGQVLSYMGDLQTAEPKISIRGILVAADFTGRAIAAARPVPNLELRKYAFKFSFHKAGS
jgi:RecB family endonuclease NucS